MDFSQTAEGVIFINWRRNSQAKGLSRLVPSGEAFDFSPVCSKARRLPKEQTPLETIAKIFGMLPISIGEFLTG